MTPRVTKNSRELNGLRTWIEINQRALRHNFNVFKRLIARKTKLMAVVKSNAYGHGLVDFARAAARQGADWIGVDSMTEARALRREGISLPLLVLGYTVPELFSEAAERDIALTVSCSDTLRALEQARLPRPLKVHVKVDTGMHRQGFLPEQHKVLMAWTARQRTSIVVEGLYTHFANAKNPAFPHDTHAQIDELNQWVAAFHRAGFTPLVHAAATAGILLFPEAQYDLVRIGIGLYGLWPAAETEAFLHDAITLRPVLTWKSFIVEIKRVPKGSRVGYDYAETLTRDSVLGIVPVGYWHGYPRSLSSVGRVLVGSQECRVLGRVSMDMITIDLTSLRRSTVGEIVTLIGTNQASPASANGIARLTDSSWYEVVTRLNPLIKRVYR